MPPRLQINALVLFVALLWGALLVLQGIDVRPDLFRAVSTVTGAVVLLLALFDNWLWRVPVLQGWFVKRPDVSGTWRVTFQTSWEDPNTGRVPGPITGFMVVRQTYSSISMRLLTKESSSEFVADELAVSPDGRFVIFAVYRNEPQAQVRNRSPIHYGALKLVVQGSPAARLEGVYWTDRLTRGDITLTERRKATFESVEAAAAEFGSSI